METVEQRLFDAAKKIAYALGITVYIRDGKVFQNPPGQEVQPGEGALPSQNCNEVTNNVELK